MKHPRKKGEHHFKSVVGRACSTGKETKKEAFPAVLSDQTDEKSEMQSQRQRNKVRGISIGAQRSNRRESPNAKPTAKKQRKRHFHRPSVINQKRKAKCIADGKHSNERTETSVGYRERVGVELLSIEGMYHATRRQRRRG